MRAEAAADAGAAAQAAKQPPLVFTLTVSDAAVVVPLSSSCVLSAAVLVPCFLCHQAESPRS